MMASDAVAPAAKTTQQSQTVFFKVVEGPDFSFEQAGRRRFDSLGCPLATDWSGIYLQLTIPHALAYLSHKAELSKSRVLLLVKFAFRAGHDQPVHLLTDPTFGQGHVPGAEKAKLAKKQLGLHDDQLLMDSLKQPLMLLDNPDDFELIVPHALFSNDVFEATVLRKYRVNSLYDIQPLSDVNDVDNVPPAVQCPQPPEKKGTLPTPTHGQQASRLLLPEAKQ